jgi:hypothetical protein
VIQLAMAALPGRLDPGNAEAAAWLRAELAKAAYRDTRDPLQRALDAIADWFFRLLSGVDGPTRALPTFVAAVVAVGVVALVAYLLRFVRRTPRRRGEDLDSPLGGERLTAAELRTRAQRAFDETRYAACLLDAMRAIARGCVERTLLEDSPSLTAHEIAERLAGVFPAQAGELRWAATRFDAVAYGGADASRAETERLLWVEAAVRGARPVRHRAEDESRGLPVGAAP